MNIKKKDSLIAVLFILLGFTFTTMALNVGLASTLIFFLFVLCFWLLVDILW